MLLCDARKARSHHTASRAKSASKANLRKMTAEWWAYLFDVARGAYFGPLPPRILGALKRRGLVDAASGLTVKGYDALISKRGDPANMYGDATIAYYESLRDAPAWPKDGDL